MNARHQLPPPKDWQDFERLCWELWKEIWNDPNAQRNGRQGQPQSGVDIFGRPGGGSRWYGVQCKKAKTPLNEKAILEEVAEAKTFCPSLTTLIIATTNQRSTSVQRIARQITEENERQGLFSVVVLGWDDIVERLYEHPGVLNRWYALDVSDEHEHIRGFNPFTICIEVIPELGGRVAKEVLADLGRCVLSRHCEATLYFQADDSHPTQQSTVS